MTRTLLFLMLILITSALFSQPELTNANTQIVAGDSFNIAMTNYVSPGNAGANQTWDLSSMGMNTSRSVKVVHSNSAPGFASFPSSNLAFIESNGTNLFFNASSTAMEFFGRYFNNGSIPFKLTNPEDWLHFPLNFNDSYTDSYSGITGGGDPYVGIASVTYDGYGALILPNGTYADVVRIHFVSEYTINGTDSLIFDEYRWYKPGNHYNIARLISWEWINVAAPILSGEYLMNISTGIQEKISRENYLDLYPNPAVEEINLVLDKKTSGLVQIDVLDMTGRICMSLMKPAVDLNNKFGLDISHLAGGTYFLKVTNGEFTAGKKFVKL